jgi:hypothetical protein
MWNASRTLEGLALIVLMLGLPPLASAGAGLDIGGPALARRLGPTRLTAAQASAHKRPAAPIAVSVVASGSTDRGAPASAMPPSVAATDAASASTS